MLQEYVSMKAKELRYGNKVTLGDGVVRTVIETREKSVYLQGMGYAVWVDNLLPIELTVETIEKNFTKSDRFKGFWELGELYSITENSNYGFILCALDIDEFGGGYYVPCIPCTYFHELQNLLVDLRIDKNIEI